jgi:hypothetical protein
MNSQPSIDRKNQNWRQPLRTSTFAGSIDPNGKTFN